MENENKIKRCAWIENYSKSELMTKYHDEEWGRPQHGDQNLFELMSLETYQSGLSWLTVINKRAAFNRVFYNYDLEKVAAMGEDDFERLMNDASIIRNRLKIRSTINNAQAMLKIQAEFGSFDDYLWQFVNGKPINHQVKTMADIAPTNDLAKTIAKDLKKHGFKFLGPITTYSFLQGAGLINDHEVTCAFH